MEQPLLISPAGSFYTSDFIPKIIDNAATLVLTNTGNLKVYKSDGTVALGDRLENIKFKYTTSILKSKNEIMIGGQNYIFRVDPALASTTMSAGGLIGSAMPVASSISSADFFKNLEYYKTNGFLQNDSKPPGQPPFESMNPPDHTPQSVGYTQGSTDAIGQQIVQNRRKKGFIFIISGSLAFLFWLFFAIPDLYGGKITDALSNWYPLLLGIVLIYRGFYERRK